MTSSAYTLREVTDSVGLTYQTFEVAPYDQCLRGAVINGVAYGTITTVDEDELESGSYNVAQNYPNPFNPTTTIRYELPEQAFVTLKVYNVLGQEVATLVSQEQVAGSYHVQFDATGLASGVYLYRLQAADYFRTKKLVLLK